MVVANRGLQQEEERDREQMQRYEHGTIVTLAIFASPKSGKEMSIDLEMYLT